MGIVHHSNYPVYFELGRTDFFAQHLIHYAELEKLGLFAPVLELSLQLKQPITYGDTLRLLTRPESLTGLRLSMTYLAFNQKGQEVASGRTLHALCGPQLRPVHPRHFGEVFDKLKAVFIPQ